ncbi:peptidyl-prolyl cis-trans isomerase FKBP11 [Anolis sagrei]|uniref:peptidyl-prolyl cis-trans isomerase FKBP11 n=1 Tax=Anolis sagrei TaxID=38937 RepID=UPI003521C8C1
MGKLAGRFFCPSERIHVDLSLSGLPALILAVGKAQPRATPPSGAGPEGGHLTPSLLAPALRTRGEAARESRCAFAMLPRPRRAWAPFGLCLLLFFFLLGCCKAQQQEEENTSETPLRTLQLETLVAAPEGCTERSAVGDTIQIHYTGTLEDGHVIDTSLSRDPLVVELGKRQVIPGLEQALLDMCVGEKRRVIIPPQLAYGKRGSPPAVPADAVLQFEVEAVGLSRANYWQKMSNEVLPLVCIGLVPALLGLIGYYLYKKAQAPRVSKKKLKEEKRNKAKKK